MAKVDKREAAQMLALRGDVDGAFVAFTNLRNGGDVAAAASLAELKAFRGQWQEALAYIKSVLLTPSSVSTINVYTDMVLLAARCCVELGSWDALDSLAKATLKNLKSGEDNVALDNAVARLIDFARRRDPEAELILIDPLGSLEERKARFELAIDKMAKDAKKKFKTPADRLEHLFGVAVVLDYQQGAVQLFDQEQTFPNIFNNVTFTASALARASRPEDAWHGIEQKLHLWWPVEVTQVAPVSLLADQALRLLMTPERCEHVLKCPRGPGVS